jgi:hypothetical protein
MVSQAGTAAVVSDGIVSPAGTDVVLPGVVTAVSDGSGVEGLPANAQPVSVAAANNKTSMTVILFLIKILPLRANTAAKHFFFHVALILTRCL